MKLISSRSLSDLKPVLMDENSSGPDPVYEVFTDIEESGWVNKTILHAGLIGQEYPKTFGHYHSTPKDEIYKVIEGEGYLLRQKLNEKGEISEIILTKLEAGSEVTITPEWGHCLINTGQTDLVVLDNWSWGHKDSDYDPIKNSHGMSFYLTEQDQVPTPVKNPHYLNLPDPKMD